MAREQPLRILLIEDNPGDVRLIEEMLHDIERSPDPHGERRISTPTLTHASRLDDGCEHLETGTFDVVLLDLDLPDSAGFSTLETVLATTDSEPIVVLTGMQDEQFGIKAVKRGAQDYLVKGEVTSDVLVRSLHHAIDRKRYERKLRQKGEELAILHRVVRHDIRNEMSLVIGQAEMLADYVDADAQAELEALLKSSNHVIELTRTVGDLVDSITGDDIELKPIDVGNVLGNEIEKADSTYPAAEFRVVDELPSVRVRSNEMLSSVFGNLLSNAVRHNDKSQPEVTVSVINDDGELVVHIADNGPGIPDEWKEEIFGRGEKGLESPGTGVGLYLVHKLVDQYGGDVWVADNEPEGSVFSVALPVF